MPDTIFETTPENKEEVVKPTVPQEEVEKYKERGLDELAKGKAYADKFIDFLEGQNKELKDELDKRLTAEASLEEMKKSAADQAAKEARETEVSEEATTSGLKPEDISTLVAKEISKADEAKIVKKNIDLVDAKIKELYSDKATDFIEGKSVELGLSKTALGELAAKSPKAFFDMVGLSEKTTDDTTVVSTSTINTEAITDLSSGAVTQGSHKYYNELRKKDPRHFYTPAIQQRLFKDRVRLGEKFYE